MKRRTTIEIDTDLVEEVMRRYGLRTKTAAVHMALERLAVKPMTLEEALATRGAHLIGEIPPDQPPRGVDD